MLIISMVTLFAVGGNAQTKNARVGFKLGPTFDWASSGSVAASSNGMGLGFNAGLLYDHYFSEHIAVSSGVNLDLLRVKYSFMDYRYVDDFLERTDVLVMRRLKTTNIEIPIMLKLRYNVKDSFFAYVQAGGGIGFNCKDRCKDEYSFYWVSSSSESFEDCSNQYRLLQLSMKFGLGAEFEVNRKLGLFVQLTFDHAFSNAFVSSLEQQTGSIIRNNFIGVEVGFMH